MRRKIRKALDMLLIPPSSRNSAKRGRRQECAKKTPIVDLAARLFLAGAFIMGLPITAEPTPVTSVHARDDAFAALQDFVQTQRVAPLNFAQSPSPDQASARETSGARDPYSVLRDFVRVANSSGAVPLPMRGQGGAPDDAIHAGLHGATASGGDAYSVLQDFVKTADGSSGEAAAPGDATHAGLCSATASGDAAVAPDDAIHAGLCSATASGGEAVAPDDAIHAGLRAAASGAAAVAPDDAIHAGLRAAASGAAAVAPDDAIHAGLRAAASGGGASSGVVSFAKIADASAAPYDSFHAGLKGAANTGSDEYAALLDFAQTVKATEPVLVAAADRRRVKIKKAVSAASEDASGFAKGDPQVCLGCHSQDPHIRAFLKYSPMARKGDQRTPMAGVGCETCHGPSAAHVASRSKGGDVEPAVVFSGPHASPVEQLNEQCMNCHEGGQRINWVGSKMQNDGVACVSCHTVHVAKDPVLVKKTQPFVCFACHQQQRAESLEYSHHPIQEGLVACSDCHNPHGSAGPYALKEFSVNETCYNCHQDKRGPMLWEHQPVREDCTNCHNPHGSTEARLMKENMGFMCSSCHSAVSNNSGGAFGGAHALPGNLLGKALFNSALGNQRLCLNCHSQIHGSNSPNGAYFFR